MRKFLLTVAAVTAAITAFAANPDSDGAKDFRQFALKQAGMQFPKQKTAQKEKTAEQMKRDIDMAQAQGRALKAQMDARNRIIELEKKMDEHKAAEATPAVPEVSDKAPARVQGRAGAGTVHEAVTVSGRKAGALRGPSSGPYFGGQWHQPYQSYSDKALRGTDLMFGTSESDARRIGGSSYTYNDKGEVIHSEEIEFYELDVDGTYTLQKNVYDMKSDGSVIESEYIQDTKTGEWVLDYEEMSRYVGDIEVEAYEKSRTYDIASGQYIYYYYSKTESEFDEAGRVKSIVVSYNNTYTEDGLVPLYRYEYEYSADGIPARIESRYSAGAWIIGSKTVDYTDNDGVRNYEYYDYDSSTQTFQGLSKSQSKEVDGWTQWQISWSWDDSDNVWNLSSKTEYEYDDAGNMILQKRYYRTSDDSDWYLRYAEGNIYDGDEFKGSWSISRYSEQDRFYGDKSEYEKDSYGRTTQIISYDLADGESLTWTPSSKEDIVYFKASENDRLIKEEILSSWNSVTGAWQYDYRNVYDFDEYGNQILYEYYIWNESAWQLNEKTVNRYAVIGDITQEVCSEYYCNYDGSEEGLVGVYKNEYDYDIYGNCIMNTYYNWDRLAASWVGSSRTESEYDSNGRDTGYVEYGWDDSQMAWIPTYMWATKYDEKGNVVEEIYMYGEVYYGGYYSGERTVYGFDDNGNEVLNEKYDWDATLEQWIGSTRIVSSYSLFLGKMMSLSIQVFGTGDDGAWKLAGKTELSQDELDTSHYTITTSYLYGDEWQVTKLVDITVDPLTSDYFAATMEDSYGYGMYNTEAEEIKHLSDTVLTVSYMWDYDEEKWAPSRKEYSVERDGCVFTESYYYDSYSECWVGSEKEDKGFNAAGQQVMTASYYWDSWAEKWYGSYKYESEEDAYGNAILSASYNWDYDTDSWYGSYKNEYAYDAKGNRTMSAYYEWDNDNSCWIGESKYEYGYDANGYETVYASYRWNNSLMAFVGSYKEETIYDAEGNRIGDVEYNWDDVKIDWIAIRKTIRYDSDEEYCFERYLWDEETSAWVGSEKYTEEYIYEDWHDEIMKETDYKWENGEWVISYRAFLDGKYDTDYNCEYELAYSENYVGGKWVPGVYYKVVYNYALLSGVDAVSGSVAIRVSDGCIVVDARDGAAVSVTSMNGSVVVCAEGPATLAVPAGIYVVTVDKVSTKVIVR